MSVIPARIRTNAFEVLRLPQETFTQYDIAVTPPGDSPRPFPIEKKQRLMHNLQANLAPSIFGKKLFFYDGGKMGYASLEISTRLGEGTTFCYNTSTGRPISDQEWSTLSERSPAVKITFSQTASIVLRPQDIAVILNNVNDLRREAVTNLLQLVIRQDTNNIRSKNGKAYFPGLKTVSKELRACMALNRPDEAEVDIRRGIFHSVRPAVDRMIVTIDAATAAFYHDGWLPDVALKFINPKSRSLRDLYGLDDHAKGKDADRRIRDFKMLNRYFKGLKITVKTSKGTKTIRSFVPDGGYYTFMRDGREMTVKEHYQEIHCIPLLHPEAPGVVLRDDPEKGIKVVVPMEVCSVIPDQFFKKKLPSKITGAMVKQAVMDPRQRIGLITEAVKQYGQFQSMSAAKMEVSTTPLTVEGKFLSPPPVTYSQNRQEIARDGKWNVVGKRFYEAKHLTFWGVINFEKLRDTRMTLDPCLDSLSDCADRLGMNPQRYMFAMDGNPYNVGETMKNVYDTVKRKSTILEGLSPQSFILLVILPDEAAEIRQQVKFFGDAHFGIKTQCVKVSKFKNDSNQYYNNLLLKINAKLGGINSVVKWHSDKLRRLFMEKTVIVGADVSHPGSGITNRPSVASLVFSWDEHGTKYAAKTSIQKPRVETIEDLENMMSEALQYLDRKGRGPTNIVFFRDGVSEGEYDNVRKVEIAAVERAIATYVRFTKRPRPRLTFLVVTKRHHTVLFPADPQVGDARGNCKAGVVVDTDIVQPHVKNYYLQSHAAIQGTSRSSHYVVLQDEVFDYDLAMLQELSFALCHVYAKATRSVSIPAPVYYADLVCSRILFHLNPEKASQLDDNISIASGQEYDERSWKRSLSPLNKLLDGAMYFV
ncbi:Piwi-domain-containing protein [Coprinopsis marcescibilis]|uniref:Piwi-domain-containing protein n=1 Tax=Coprinopsis marcescibilis TaxID=230819 RepID=A0A5C3L2V0_COPMA|nr:Piwi-domain-containing protein [Coprinopsis marcescibilis]